MNAPEFNKTIVQRFNKEFIEEGNMDSFRELVAEDAVNHTAPAGTPPGPESFVFFLKNVLHAGFSGLKVEILEQVAERDLVTTRKRITGTHTGQVMGIPPSHKQIEMKVIDIIRVKDGKYAEHWGASNFADVLAEIAAK